MTETTRRASDLTRVADEGSERSVLLQPRCAMSFLRGPMTRVELEAARQLPRAIVAVRRRLPRSTFFAECGKWTRCSITSPSSCRTSPFQRRFTRRRSRRSGFGSSPSMASRRGSDATGSTSGSASVRSRSGTPSTRWAPRRCTSRSQRATGRGRRVLRGRDRLRRARLRQARIAADLSRRLLWRVRPRPRRQQPRSGLSRQVSRGSSLLRRRS